MSRSASATERSPCASICARVTTNVGRLVSEMGSSRRSLVVTVSMTLRGVAVGDGVGEAATTAASKSGYIRPSFVARNGCVEAPAWYPDSRIDVVCRSLPALVRSGDAATPRLQWRDRLGFAPSSHASSRLKLFVSQAALPLAYNTCGDEMDGRPRCSARDRASRMQPATGASPQCLRRRAAKTHRLARSFAYRRALRHRRRIAGGRNVRVQRLSATGTQAARSG